MWYAHVCLGCKREFSEQYRKKRKKKYCTVKCAFRSIRTPRKQKQCSWCFKIFLPKNRLGSDYRPNKFCSRLCLFAYNKAHTKPPTEIGSRNWARLIRMSLAYKDWRRAVIKKFGRKCAMCGITKEDSPTTYFDADHIEAVAVNPSRIFDVENGRILCRRCHRKTNTWGWRAHKLKVISSKSPSPPPPEHFVC